MPVCVQCSRTDAEGVAVVSCDKCGSEYCQQCASLTSREVKAIEVKTRIIKFFCHDCASDPSKTMAPAAATAQASQDISRDAIPDDISAYLKPLCEKISVLERELSEIKKSNLELIKLLTKKPQEIKDKKNAARPDKAENDLKNSSADKTLKENIHYNTRSTSSGTKNSTGSVNKGEEVHAVHPQGHSTENDPVSEEYMLVHSKRRNRHKKPVILGTAEIGSDENAFEGRDASNKKAWLFVSRVKDTVTEEIVRKYIASKTNAAADELVVKQIPTNYQRKDSRCFQIGIRFDLKDLLYTPEFWPSGVAFRRYRFNLNASKQAEDLSNEKPFLS